MVLNVAMDNFNQLEQLASSENFPRRAQKKIVLKRIKRFPGGCF